VSKGPKGKRGSIREDDMRGIMPALIRKAHRGDADATRLLFNLQIAAGRGDLVRAVIRHRVTLDDLKAIVIELVELAKAGDQEAAQLVLEMSGPMADVLDGLGLTGDDWAVIVRAAKSS
jgi:hypothetical protein